MLTTGGQGQTQTQTQADEAPSRPPFREARRDGASEDIPYKVYVILGFHASFYHSWRGDTPDEAGFGTDILRGTLASGRESAWTPEVRCVPWPVKAVSLVSAASGVSPWAMLRLVYYSLSHALTTK